MQARQILFSVHGKPLVDSSLIPSAGALKNILDDVDEVDLTPMIDVTFCYLFISWSRLC